MAIADTIKKIEYDVDRGNLQEAETLLLEVLTSPESQKSFKILLLHAQYLFRSKKYPESIKVSSAALALALENGKRMQISEALKMLSLCYFKHKDLYEAFKYVVRACSYDDAPNSEIKMLKNVVAAKYGKSKNLSELQLVKKEKDILSTPLSSQVELPGLSESGKKTPAQITPKMDTAFAATSSYVKQNMRTDWFDSGKTVEVSVYIKKINPDSIVFDIKENRFSITFSDSNGFQYCYHVDELYDFIDESKSSFKIYGTKLTILMVKKDNSKSWKSLDAILNAGTATHNIPKEDVEKYTSYPSSNKKKVEWSKFDIDDDEEGGDYGESDSPEGFFKKLYENADPDARRAMMKSFTESNGTSLSTDWSDVGSRDIKPYSEDSKH